MRKIFAIAWKDTLVRFSSRSELLFFIVLPVVFTFVLSGAITKLSQGDNRLPVLVADQDNTPLSAELLTALGQSRRDPRRGSQSRHRPRPSSPRARPRPG